MVFWPLLHGLKVSGSFFLIWAVINQGIARCCSFGGVGECDKHAYGPSPTGHNAFFLQARPSKTLICSLMATV
jgi:hypothetical protein